MLSKIKQLRYSDFIKNAFTLITGSSIAQIIPIFTAPILSRIYEPKDYGKLGLYMGISVILGIVSTLQYSNAVLLPKDEKDFLALIKLSIFNSFFTSTILAILLIFLKHELALLIKGEMIEKFLLFLPFSMLMNGVSNTLYAFANRMKFFKIVAFNRVIASIVTVITSITLGLILHDWIGLFVGYLLSQFINSFLLFYNLYRITPRKIVFDTYHASVHNVRKRYVNFPKYSLITDMINGFTYQIPVFLLNIFSGSNIVGLYNMCNRLLAMPILFISSAVSEVFKQKASEEFHKTGSCRSIFLKTFKTLSLLSLFPFIILIIWGPQIFSFFLGEKWFHAGTFARILAPVFLLKFINSPLSFIIYLFQKLQFDLLATIYLTVTSFLILYFSLSWISVESSLMLFSGNYALTYIFMLNYSSRLSKISI